MTIRPRGAAWSARLPVTQEIVGSNPIGDAGQDSTVRKPAKRRSSNLRERLWVRLPSVLLANRTCVGWALAGLAGCKPAVRTDPGGSTPSRRTRQQQITARCDAGFAARLSISPTRVRFPSASLFWLGVMLVLQSGPQPGRTNPGIRARSVPGSIPVRVTEHGQVVEPGRHATLRRSCPRGRASSTLALATDATRDAGGQAPSQLS